MRICFVCFMKTQRNKENFNSLKKYIYLNTFKNTEIFFCGVVVLNQRTLIVAVYSHVFRPHKRQILFCWSNFELILFLIIVFPLFISYRNYHCDTLSKFYDRPPRMRSLIVRLIGTLVRNELYFCF